MFKKIIMFGLAQVLIAGAVYAAPDRIGKVDVGFNISAANMEDANTAAYFGGNMSYGVNETSAIGFSLGYQSFNSDLGGDLNGVPFLVDVYFRSLIADRSFVPYAVLGLGGIAWDFEEEALASGSTVNIDTSFAVKLGGGVDFFINDKWAINLEATYTIADSETTITNSAGSVTATADADFWNLGGGLKYIF